MVEVLYAKTISLDTVPKVGKQYGLRYTWRATEPLTERNVRDAFEVIEAHFEARYPARVLRIIGVEPEVELQPELQFLALEPTDLTLKEIWDETRAFALEHYLDLTFKEAVIYRPRFPWWLLVIAAAEAGGIVYVARKKR